MNKWADEKKRGAIYVLSILFLEGKNTKLIPNTIKQFKNNKRVKEIHIQLLKRICYNKEKKVFEALRKIRSLSYRPYSYSCLKASRFAKGLNIFVERTLIRALVAFKS